GITWTQTSAPSNSWSSVASSADGSKLAAVTRPGPIYTSTDSGATWTQTSTPSNWWSSVASSADGTKLVAAGQSFDFNTGEPIGGPIYTSPDSGATWTQTSAPDQPWASVASSVDGSKLVAAVASVPYSNPGFTGFIYFSMDSGKTWTQ